MAVWTLGPPANLNNIALQPGPPGLGFYFALDIPCGSIQGALRHRSRKTKKVLLKQKYMRTLSENILFFFISAEETRLYAFLYILNTAECYGVPNLCPMALAIFIYTEFIQINKMGGLKWDTVQVDREN